MISVLIGSRNRAKVLVRCLEAVLNQEDVDLEVVVLDDGSTTPYATELAGRYANLPVRFLRADVPLGVAGGRNFLMREARGDIFVVVDDDAVFADNRALFKIQETFFQHQDVGIVALKIVDNRDGREDLLIPFSRRDRLKDRGLANKTQLVSYYLGGGHALRRTVWERLGGYQEGLVFGEEEADLSYRAIREGFKILYVPDVVVHHYPEPSVVACGHWSHRGELFYHVRNRLYLAYKYLPLVYGPVYVGIWLSRYLIRSIRLGQFRDYCAGVLSGLLWLKSVKREPLDANAIAYLKQHFGRLWY